MTDTGKSALSIMPGGEHQPAVRGDVALAPRVEPSPRELAGGVLARDRVAIGRALSLLESTAPRHTAARRELLALLSPHAGASFRLGISGVPGAGKSTFIEALGMHAIEKDQARVAVLAVDPSSEQNGGSILGDKTRMSRLSTHPDALVRPSASGAWLGGVARASREAILVCEAAGHDLVIVETVGVGQSETMAASMVDFFLVLMLPGAGDELQGIKRGILEIADGIAINKADGENLAAARLAQAQLLNALHLARREGGDPSPQIVLCSALEGMGIDRLWSNLKSWRDTALSTGRRDVRRRRQAVVWMDQLVDAMLHDHLRTTPALVEARAELEAAVAAGRLAPYDAACAMIDSVLGKPDKGDLK